MLDLLSISTGQAELVKDYWPGPLSMEFNTPNAPQWLHHGANHFAIRQPNYPELLSLIDKVGPIISTSANLQGQAPAISAEQALKIFNQKLDFYVDVGVINNKPSTLVVVDNGKLNVVREGAVKIS